jgi:hypothetical protein
VCVCSLRSALPSLVSVNSGGSSGGDLAPAWSPARSASRSQYASATAHTQPEPQSFPSVHLVGWAVVADIGARYSTDTRVVVAIPVADATVAATAGAAASGGDDGPASKVPLPLAAAVLRLSTTARKVRPALGLCAVGL